MGSKVRQMLYGAFLILLGSLLGCTPRSPVPLPDSGQRRPFALQIDGRTRHALLYLPSSYTPHRPMPLVVVVHGAFVNAAQMERFSGFSALAERAGFVVLYPNGIGLLGWFQHWNSGHCCGKALRQQVDDVGFLALAIAEVKRRYAIDHRRVYMIGHSNGAMLTYRFAAERPALVAAIGIVAGTIGGKPHEAAAERRIPMPLLPVPVIAFHGRKDAQIVYEGGRSQRGRSQITWLSVETSMQVWRQANGVQPVATTSSLYNAQVQRDIWSGGRCQAEVILYTLEDWGHAWPGPAFIQGSPRAQALAMFDTAAIAWQFFARHQRDAACM